MYVVPLKYSILLFNVMEFSFSESCPKDPDSHEITLKHGTKTVSFKNLIIFSQ